MPNENEIEREINGIPAIANMASEDFFQVAVLRDDDPAFYGVYFAAMKWFEELQAGKNNRLIDEQTGRCFSREEVLKAIVVEFLALPYHCGGQVFERTGKSSRFQVIEGGR